MEETREEGRIFFMPLKKDWIWEVEDLGFEPPKKGWEVEKMQLIRVKSRERNRDFDFMIDGEVVKRCKNIGKRWQRRVLRQKLEKKGQATSLKMAHLDEMEPKFVFKQSDQHQQGGCIRGWATRKEEAAAD